MQLPPEPREGVTLRASWGAQVVRYLRSITPRSSVDIQIDLTPNGTTFRPRPVPAVARAAATPPGPLQIVTSAPAGAATPEPLPENPLVWVTWGHVNNVVPDNILQSLEIAATTIVWLELTIDPTTTQVLSSQLTLSRTAPHGLDDDGALVARQYYALGQVTVAGDPLAISGILQAGSGSLWFGVFVSDVTCGTDGIGLIRRAPVFFRR